MKTNTRRIVIRIVVLVMLAVMVAAIRPTMVHAKKKKKTRRQASMSLVLPDVDYAGDYDREVLAQTAVSVLRGKTTLSCTGATANIVFRAPKTKTYTFTFNKLQVFESESYMGFQHPDEYAQIDVWNGRRHQYFIKTQYGTDACLQICTPEYRNEFPTKERASYTKLLSRYGKVKLRRGQRMYFHIRSCSSNWAMNLTIQ